MTMSDNPPEPKPELDAETSAVARADLLAKLDFVWQVLRDAERGLNRLGIYANSELGGVPYEVQKAHQRMKAGDFQKARNLVKSISR
jgi:hypothetical protein